MANFVEVFDALREKKISDFFPLCPELRQLRPQGKYLAMPCPFHQEKTPSFKFDPARGTFHCFGCGEGGFLFNYFARRKKLESLQAIILLARHFGIKLIFTNTKEEDAI
ncbi:MAG: CHC2 zinc finger domain-containing protein [Candidatus Moranbacteria bacterium]|nr:CHC2 zinc finger domain-containing protein [Candidatus Moranbacteria bacterium]